MWVNKSVVITEVWLCIFGDVLFFLRPSNWAIKTLKDSGDMSEVSKLSLHTSQVAQCGDERTNHEATTRYEGAVITYILGNFYIFLFFAFSLIFFNKAAKVPIINFRLSYSLESSKQLTIVQTGEMYFQQILNHRYGLWPVMASTSSLNLSTPY